MGRLTGLISSLGGVVETAGVIVVGSREVRADAGEGSQRGLWGVLD